MGQLLINFRKKTQKTRDAVSQRRFDGPTKDDNTLRTLSTETPSQSEHEILGFLPIPDGKTSPKEIICCGS